MPKRFAKRRCARRAKENDLARRLMTMPGIDPLIATAIAVLAPPPETFRKARDFAAWPGFSAATAFDRWQAAPCSHDKNGRAVAQAPSDHRCQRVIIKRHTHASAQPGTWLDGVLSRKPPMLVRVALANKMARIVWALWPAVAFTSLRPQRHKPAVGREDVGAEEGAQQS
ncbi:Transposase IS116/IS110/IS902 family [Puniceibacterium sp. IMCC21224]|nr:Transposase IS116/IS110/IS902 family [Puniceibacterium sp. IMCC21224]